MGDINTIAKQFVDFYYQTFDGPDRSQLSSLYRPGSMLSFESDQLMGQDNISAKLTGLPFQKVQHRIVSLDAQPASSTVASMVVLVTGQLLVDDSENPIHFSQVFHLIPEGGSYFVQNDVFRLNYG